MSSDTVPIVQSATPPSYMESQIQHGNISQPQPAMTNQPASSVNPPPYSPPTYVLESSGSGYQHFDEDRPVTLVSVINLNKESCLVVCPSCGKQVLTLTKPVPGAITCLVAALCLFICLPCVVVPFCIADLQDVSHSCPVCKCHIGTYTRV